MSYRKTIFTPIGDFRAEISNGKGLRFAGLGLDLGAYDGDELQVAIYLGVLHIWLTYSARWVYKLTGVISKLHGGKYPRSYNNHIHLGRNLSIKICGDHVGDNALFSYYLDIPKLLKGKSRVERQVLKTGETEVVMPEGVYPATYEVERITHHYPRWFKSSHEIIDVRINDKGGIPYEGKGGGMDGLCAQSSTYTGNIRAATEAIAMYVLKRRQRYSRLDKYKIKPNKGAIVGEKATA